MGKWSTTGNLHHLGPGTTLVTGPAANWLIVRDGEAYTLVDCGYPDDRELVDASIAAAGATGLPEAVVVTHAHADHIGTLGRFADAGVPIHCAAAEVPNMTGTSREQIGPRGSLPRALRSWRWAKWCVHAIRTGGLRDVTVAASALTPFDTDVEVLDLPGAMRPVATTGHTSGHTSFLIGDTGVVAAGDAVITGHMTSPVLGAPQMLPAPYHHDPVRAEDTALRLLSGADFGVLAPGHGGPLPVPAGTRLVLH
ncbi:MBL fold metallo-hydrolase [Kocuria sp. U4B]